MSDAVTTTVAGVATGVATFPILAQFGLDPLVMIPALGGCIVAQSLLPSKRKEILAIAAWTIGSVIFAGGLAPLLMPWAVQAWNDHMTRTPEWAIRLATSMFLGAFAQPITLLTRRVFSTAIRKVPIFKFLLSEEEASDA